MNTFSSIFVPCVLLGKHPVVVIVQIVLQEKPKPKEVMSSAPIARSESMLLLVVGRHVLIAPVASMPLQQGQWFAPTLQQSFPTVHALWTELDLGLALLVSLWNARQ
jgi:hypothetical protein